MTFTRNSIFVRFALAGPLVLGSAWATPTQSDSRHETDLAVPSRTPSSKRGATTRSAPSVAKGETTWHARLGLGVNPALGGRDNLPTAKTGLGGSLSAFRQLPYRLSLGPGFDLERYTYDTTNPPDSTTGQTLFTDVELYFGRIMALLQWDILERKLVNPFLLVGLGFGIGHAEIPLRQCSPSQPIGPVVGVGAGVDIAIGETLGLGFEYRGNSPPITPYSCAYLYMPDAPRGAPLVISHRFGLTLSFRK